MRSNDSIEKIASALREAKSALIFPHVNPDGDAVGSAAALCLALRKLGVDAWAVLECKLPENFLFLERGAFCIVGEGEKPQAVFDRLFGGEAPEFSICVDCGSVERFEKTKDVFLAGKRTVCIDHHGSSEPFTEYCYIDPERAACAEIIFDLVRAMEKQTGRAILDVDIADEIYAGIITDTGNFEYSNTTTDTHRIAIELMEAGVRHTQIGIEIYQTQRPEKIRIAAMAIERMRLLADGQIALTWVTQEMLEEAKAYMDETEGIVDTLRSVKGVELAIFVKEYQTDEIKVSTRSKNWLDVAKLCERFGGGGHMHAAGCTFRTNIENAIAVFSEAAEDCFK